MKILAIHNFYQIQSGEDLAFRATIDALRKAGHEVVTYTRDNREIDATNPKASPRTSKLRLGLGTFFSLHSFFQVCRRIKEHQPDVALVQNVFPLLSPSVYLALKWHRIPVIQRVFNYRSICPNGVLYTQGKICERCKHGAYWNAVLFKCYRRSRLLSAVLAASLWIWRALGVWRWGVQRYLTPDTFLGTKILAAVKNPEKIRVLHNPALPETSPPHVSGLRTQEVLFVGRLVREKGIFTYVETAKALPEKTFQVIGTGEDEAEAKRFAKELRIKNLVWNGPIYGQALETFLDRVGVLVLPSQWYDNIPLILTQAMLRKTPIVASRINGIPEFIQPEKTGRLAEPQRAEDFAKQIRAVFKETDKTKEMSEAAYQLGKDAFSEEKFLPQLEQYLSDV